ncbi:DNA repair protein RecN [Mangrovibacillus cuniculi]|uniref:DNA repair protein RecN n=1 Tax=Mangrovibacillus cuniculi TaxID=2593652 RepID=A0A7S8CB98_9BACI|nr:DNA repair protein RecN [Mangrovibacillus cuniculi]QPC46817.1 DNA repair protein RecN [Mangrovibacillus cuniculi]
MLTELTIKNFAIITELSVPFQEGLTVLTGETGAGKSIIIDAVHLLVGGRGSTDFIRHGEDKAELEGLFFVDRSNHPVYEKAQEFGLTIEDGMIVFRRDIYKNGKSVCRVNGKLVTIATLREVGATLMDIHGQHETQSLLQEHQHISLLDHFAKDSLEMTMTQYQELYRSYKQVKKRLDEISSNEQQIAHRIDLLSFQVNEIQQAALKTGEDEELQEERKRLSNFEKLYESLQNSYEMLKGEQKGLDWISIASREVEFAASLDSEMESVSENVQNSYYALEDAASTIRNMLDGLEFQPERLNEIEHRLNELNQLKRKYGSTIAEVIQYGEEKSVELDELLNREGTVNDLEKQLSSIEEDLKIEAKALSEERTAAAVTLTEQIHDQLQQLYMEKARFHVNIATNEGAYTSSGIDEVTFLISTNQGEPLKPLAKIASGGELSRIMLALKTIFSRHQGVTSIIFDEVDTGVSGRVAQSIAEKIYQVAVHSQVLCISHLPQVAALADTHLFISKRTENGRTFSSVLPLSETDKIDEIGRMISGIEVTELTRKHAKELVTLAKTVKKQPNKV